ncbi:MAG: ATP-dependent protease LonB [Oscillospiraceae bacterium]|nr:ATP-dependent protease LonB [Oscillospiraceae bacterium]
MIMTLIILNLILTAFLFINIFMKKKHFSIDDNGPVYRDNSKEMENLNRLKKISLTLPLTEVSRPSSLKDIIGQEMGTKALIAALCSPNPQHVIIYGPPGIGKTAAARLVLDYAKTLAHSPFKEYSKFVEIDATTIRFDDRGIADPLIGSVHDPIYQGAGSLGVSGVPQPKPGVVTKAHGGILFIDEIGELHPIVMNKLLKVLEDRKVFFESSYYNPNDSNTPQYVKDIFNNGLPADFRLVGATTRSPEELPPAIRSRCTEIFFRGLSASEICEIARGAAIKINYGVDDDAIYLVGEYCTNGRECINVIQLASGIAFSEGRRTINKEDIEWVIENGQYNARIERKINKEPKAGFVTGLAVYGNNNGTIMEIESVSKILGSFRGKLVVTGIVEEEEINFNNRKIKRKSMAKCSVENVMTVLSNIYNMDFRKIFLHVNFLGGVPVDGPSAGITIVVSIMSSLFNIPVKSEVAMTGEVSICGDVKPVGGVSAKIKAAIEAGAKEVIIPKDNYKETYSDIKECKIHAVSDIDEVLSICFGDNILKCFNKINKEIKTVYANLN